MRWFWQKKVVRRERWYFYQDVTGTWRWIHLDEAGKPVAYSRGIFENRTACLDNARSLGYRGDWERERWLKFERPPA